MDQVVHEVIKFKGIVTDIPPAELVNEPVWTGGQNVHFDDRSTHRCGGYGTFAAPLPGTLPDVWEPIFLHNVLTPQTAYWIWVGRNRNDQSMKIWVTDGSSHFDITPAAGVSTNAVAGTWTGTLLNNIPVLNNPFDVPVWWDGNTGNIMTPLPDWDTTWRCKAIRAFKYHLVALNMTENSVDFPEKLRWSASADPGQIPASWTPLAENDAGDNILAEELGGIVDGLPLHGAFCIYRAHSMALMSYVGGQFVFQFREVFPTQGVQNINCVVECRGKHWVFADDDVIVHDGNSLQSIIDQRNRRLLFESFSDSNRQLCQVAGRTATDEIWFIVPAADYDYQRLALVYSITEDTWGIRNLPDTAHVGTGIVPNEAPDPTWDGSPYGSWENDPRWWNQSNYSISNDELLMASVTDDEIYHVDDLHSNNGAPVEAFVERLYHTLGADEDIGGGAGRVGIVPNAGDRGVWQNMLIRSIYPRVTGTIGDQIEVRVGATQSMGAPITWGTPQTLQVGKDNKVDTMVHGRYFHFRITSSGGDPWQLHRVGIEYVPLSKW